jgi:nitronate monooxygenase
VIELEHPIVCAPMAGGQTTPALAAAVSAAGGLGFLAAGYKTAAALADDIAAARRLTDRPLGVNLFLPQPRDVDERALEAYADRLRPEAERYGVELGEPRWGDDDWDAKVELLLRDPPAVVSTAFGCPAPELVGSLRAAGAAVWCTVTTPAEATIAADAGVDALVVQGAEAGAHRSSFVDGDEEPLGLLDLLELVRAETPLPLVAAGGIGDAAGVEAVLAAGARAAQIGTGFLLADEAGTSTPHRAALTAGGATTFTRAFTGRRARGLVNRFVREHSAHAPSAYPHVNNLTAPIRAAARAAGDADALALWAGTSHRLARAAPAADLVRRFARAE